MHTVLGTISSADNRYSKNSGQRGLCMNQSNWDNVSRKDMSPFFTCSMSSTNRISLSLIEIWVYVGVLLLIG